MESSIILPEISEIKKFICEAYEDSKKKINLRSNAILNEIAMIKKEQENFYLKTIEILLKYENDGIDYLPIQTQSRESSSTNHRNKSKSPANNLLKNSMNIKESFTKNKIDYMQNIKKKKNEYAKKNTIKTATHKQIESIIKSKVKNRPNISISQMKKQNKIKIGGGLVYSTTSTSIKNGNINSPPLKETAKRSNTLYSKHIANSTIVKTDNVYDNKNEVKREDKRKMTDTEIRKFSIIDIPCIQMNENNKIQNDIRYRNINSNNVFMSSLNFTDDINSDLSLHEKLCLILAKSNVIPLKQRIIFSTMIPKVYSTYPPSEILKDYIEMINEKIKKINQDVIYVNKFHPSITAQTTLKFIMEKEEQSFFSDITNDNDNIVLHLLQLLHLICGNEFNEKINTVEELKKFLLTNINGSLLSKYILLII